MKLLNGDTWNQKKLTVFITSYSGLEYFNSWSGTVLKSPNMQLVVIDTGQQDDAVRNITQIPVFQVSQNVGCAGCWNLACNLGFNYYGLEKIVIGQDDAIFNEIMVDRIWEESTDDLLVGAYDRAFTYSLFGITKNFWNAVGVFDENFVFVTYEDNDYIYRTRLFGKQTKSLNYSADLNSSITSRALGDDVRSVNRKYMIDKWGHFEGVFSTPFNDPTIKPNECSVQDNIRTVYGSVDTFPSITEFELFKNQSTLKEK